MQREHSITSTHSHTSTKGEQTQKKRDPHRAHASKIPFLGASTLHVHKLCGTLPDGALSQAEEDILLQILLVKSGDGDDGTAQSGCV